MSIAVGHQAPAPRDPVADAPESQRRAESRLTGKAGQSIAALVRVALAAFAFLLFQSAYWVTGQSLVSLVAFGAVAVLSCLNLPASMLLVAGLGPLASVLSMVSGFPQPRAAEPLVLAFIGGWMLRSAWPPARDSASSSQPTMAATLLAVAVSASVLVSLAVVRAGWTDATSFESRLIEYLAREYLEGRPGVFRAVPPGLLIIEGLGLMAAVASICSASPRWSRALVRISVASGVGAASLSVLRLVTALIRNPYPFNVASRLLSGHVRLSIHVGDLNAAGSYFVLLAFIAAGASAGTGRSKLAWRGSVGALVLGLLLSGSRAAIWAGLVTLVTGACLVRVRLSRSSVDRRTARRRFSWTILLALVVVALLSNVLLGGRAWDSLVIRWGFTQASLQMLATRPIFGVGIGNYIVRSPEFLPDWLQAIYSRENAHNYFLQVTAELGLVGGLLFAAVTILPLVRAMRVWWARTPLDPHLGGLIGGLAAFLLTCLSGHPLLLASVAYPFWTLLGLLIATAHAPIQAASPEPAFPPARRTSRWLAPLAATAILFSVPLRSRAALATADMRDVSRGFSGWRTGPDGQRYRAVEADATFFVPRGTRALRLLVRREPGRPGQPTGVDITLDGKLVNHLSLVDDRWIGLRMLLPRQAGRLPQRIDIIVSPASTPSEPRRVYVGDVINEP